MDMRQVTLSPQNSFEGFSEYWTDFARMESETFENAVSPTSPRILHTKVEYRFARSAETEIAADVPNVRNIRNDLGGSRTCNVSRDNVDQLQHKRVEGCRPGRLGRRRGNGFEKGSGRLGGF
jgi:hypothetical protein